MVATSPVLKSISCRLLTAGKVDQDNPKKVDWPWVTRENAGSYVEMQIQAGNAEAVIARHGPPQRGRSTDHGRLQAFAAALQIPEWATFALLLVALGAASSLSDTFRQVQTMRPRSRR